MKEQKLKTDQASSSIPPIPRLIMKNTVFFALAQALQGVGMQLAVTFSAIMVIRILGNASLAGLGGGILGISRFAVAYPMGKLTDVYGRKPGMLIGLLMTTTGSIILGFCMTTLSFPLFVIGILILGLGVGAVMQLRVAAADMYPVSRRAEGLGYVLTGSVIGAFGAPILVALGEVLSKQYSYDPITISWGLTPVVLMPALIFILLVRPDPKFIAMNLEKFWEGETGEKVIQQQGSDSNVGIKKFLKDKNKQVAFSCYGAAQGTMAMMMVMTPLVLSESGYSLSSISLTVSLHVFGMFAFSVPMGRLTDRIGRKTVLGAGVILVSIGSVLVPLTDLYWVITFGLFIIGLGWSGTNVASTALIADTSAPEERGRAIGTNDSVASAFSILTPLVGGIVVEYLGLVAVGLLGGAIMLLPLILYPRLKESSPGVYA
ncbi:MAG: MFS transporter [Dehalococcoidia bacterium]